MLIQAHVISIWCSGDSETSSSSSSSLSSAVPRDSVITAEMARPISSNDGALSTKAAAFGVCDRWKLCGYIWEHVTYWIGHWIHGQMVPLLVMCRSVGQTFFPHCLCQSAAMSSWWMKIVCGVAQVACILR